MSGAKSPLFYEKGYHVSLERPLLTLWDSSDTAWERIPATDLAKEVTWSLEQDHYALTNKPLYDLGRSLRDYYGAGQDPDRMNFHTMHQLRKEARGKFMGMDMFFVKVRSSQNQRDRISQAFGVGRPAS